MSLHHKAPVSFSLLLLMLVAAVERPASAQIDPLINQPRPHFVLPDLKGKQRSISEWDGKLLVINFWASWCTPCLQEMPAFTRLQHHFADQGVQFVGVAVDDPDSVRGFLDQLEPRINYPILLGEDDAMNTAVEYGNHYGILPHTIIVDRDGKIAYTHFGMLTFEQGRMLLFGLLL